MREREEEEVLPIAAYPIHHKHHNTMTTTTTIISLDQIVYDLSMWAIDNDAELMQELAEKYFSSLSEEDAREFYGRICA